MGLYLNPPDKAIVLSVDENSQIQALDPAKPAASAQHRRPGSRAPNGVTVLGVPGSVLFRPVSRLLFQELFDWRPEGLHALRQYRFRKLAGTAHRK